MEGQTETIKRLKELGEAKNPAHMKREQEFLESLRSKLELHISQNPAKIDRAFRRKENLNSYMNIKLALNNFRIMRPGAVGAIVLILALCAGGAAFASQESLPGDKLYGVKILSEEIQSTLTLSPDSKAKLESEFAAKRVEEIKKVLSARGVEPSGLDIAIDHLQKNSANAADIIINEKEKGGDVSVLAKDVNDNLNKNQDALKQIFKDQIKDLKEQKKALKKKAKEARQAGNIALVESLTDQIDSLEIQKETLEMNRDESDNLIEAESEYIQDSMKEEEKKLEQKEKAQKAITEAENEKQDIINEYGERKIALPEDEFNKNGSDKLLEEAKDAFSRENFEEAKNLAKEAIDGLKELENDLESENESNEAGSAEDYQEKNEDSDEDAPKYHEEEDREEDRDDEDED